LAISIQRSNLNARCFARCTGRSPDSLTGSTVRDPGQAYLGPSRKPRTTVGTSRVVRASAGAAATEAKGSLARRLALQTTSTSFGNLVEERERVVGRQLTRRLAVSCSNAQATCVRAAMQPRASSRRPLARLPAQARPRAARPTPATRRRRHELHARARGEQCADTSRRSSAGQFCHRRAVHRTPSRRVPRRR
jgi:hypothetical protein